MNVQEFQKLCASTVNAIDNRYDTKRDPHFSFTQLIEEIGELVRSVNLPKLRKKDQDQNNLDDEFADVVLQLSVLAQMYNVDLEKAVMEKIKRLKEKHKLNNTSKLVG